ncbi:hypothetical protein ACQP0C_37955 [Nocardia sp. CA-129566]|uniref:hypothetical protein n=1 Tax=Nocardia sp. CA-129566 TaxID=3239976 RepID=UPI003D9598CD
MLNPALPQRTPFVGPPVAVAVDLPAELVARFADALREWASAEPSGIDHHDEGI